MVTLSDYLMCKDLSFQALLHPGCCKIERSSILWRHRLFRLFFFGSSL